jgi:hypothetical protein
VVHSPYDIKRCFKWVTQSEVGSGHVRGFGVGEGGQGELGGGEVDDDDHLVFVPVAAGAGFGCLDKGVDSFEQSVGQVACVPGDDALPVLLHECCEVFDGLQAGAFRAVAPASQVLVRIAGVLVVEGLEVLWGSRSRSLMVSSGFTQPVRTR